MENLDLTCAELGRKLSGLEGINAKLLQDALTVLEEQGLYAFFLYLEARGKEPGKKVKDECHRFLQQTPEAKPLLSSSSINLFEALENLARSLDDLLFARHLLRQALVYARYHLKEKEPQGGML